MNEIVRDKITKAVQDFQLEKPESKDNFVILLMENSEIGVEALIERHKLNDVGIVIVQVTPEEMNFVSKEKETKLDISKLPKFDLSKLIMPTIEPISDEFNIKFKREKIQDQQKLRQKFFNKQSNQKFRK